MLDELIGKDIAITPITGWSSTGVAFAVARLDQIHPALSGNKLFKLWYYLEQYRLGSYKGILTFGGAYSNHLLATAYAARALGIPCVGIVRGETPRVPGPTLEDCARWGMELRYVSREEYRGMTAGAAAHGAPAGPGGYLVIPEGGSGETGIRGAALILPKIEDIATFTHIVCAVGTGTTLQGLDRGLLPGQYALGIPVIGVPPAEQGPYLDSLGCSPQTTVHFGYAFGGYGRRTEELIGFMRSFYAMEGVPTDFVYTAKAAFALRDLATQGYFGTGSRVLLLHTGGLQGNRSLPAGLFEY